ncbi:MAG: hypothetical protein NTY63_09015 [Candidatus Bipolaricaulota bacterium]|nr:hypothetical protein [Candidatus Bipolaricaulota bacterium]
MQRVVGATVLIVILSLVAAEACTGAVLFGFRFPAADGRLADWYEMQGVNNQGLYFDLFDTPCRSEAGQSQGPVLPPPAPTAR